MHRDIEPEPRPRRLGVRAGRSVVVVIGIDEYVAWPRLANAVSDATAVSRLFRRLGFDEITAPLVDRAATSDAMRRLVTDDLSSLSADDSLVLFFAGHGHTNTAQFGDMSVKTGWVIPVDAAQPDRHASASWLRLDTWLSDVARLPPRHILVIVDACHSGISLGALHKWRANGPAPPPELSALQARRSRRIITSALDDQRALDSGPYPGHSLFTGCLLEGLSGGLAEGGRRVATGREIGLYLQRRVRSYPESTQTPDFGPFELDDRGDIVVPLISEPAPRCEPAEPRHIFFNVADPLAPGPSSHRAEVGAWRRSRADRWSTMGIVSGVLAFWLVLIAPGNDRGGHPDASADVASPNIPATPDPPLAMVPRAPTAAVPDAGLPGDAGPTATTADPVEQALRPPVPARKLRPRSTPPSNALEPMCNVAVFAAVYDDASPTLAAVSAALRQLNVCHEARLITDADFDRIQTALVAK